MRYISTRNKKSSISSSEAIIKGISEDGGLFVPNILPKIEKLEAMENMNYKEISYIIMKKFFTDFDDEALKNCIDKAYDNKFDTDIIAPVVEVNNSFILELFHGPTFAFKDMALSILPYLLKESTKITGIRKEIVILTATSGDTGKAALEGFAKVPGIKIIVFYPKNGVSEIQKKQMLTQEGENTFVVGIRGNFDDAQAGVKDIFNDREFIELIDKNNYMFSSANSINIGRLIPQIVYYFYGYLMLLKEKKLDKYEKINIVVPTGNFGNILAAYYAKIMGLPVNKLICASNENNVLSDFFRTGTYDKRRKLILTSSPSMDILISSNLERLLFHLSGENDKMISDNMNKLSKEGFYSIDNVNFKDFYSNYSTEKEVKEKISKVFKKERYLLDPHTAVAVNVYEKYRLETKDNTKTIIASTASPYKFANTVATAIDIKVKGKDEFMILKELEEKTKSTVPKTIKTLKDKAILHNNNCNKEDMREIIKEFLKVGARND